MIDTTGIPLRHFMLAAMADAPVFALAALRGDEDPETRDQIKGTITHTIVFNTATVVVPPMKRDERTAAYREWQAEHDGCHIASKAEYEIGSRLAHAVRDYKPARELIEGAECEVQRSFMWDGRICRATPDVVRPKAYIADLKTSVTADPRIFPFHMKKYHYHSAMAWYMRAVPTALDAFLIVVEKRTPYPVQVFQLSDRALAAGRELHEGWFAALRECERTGAWPAYSTEIVELDLPEPARMYERVA